MRRSLLLLMSSVLLLAAPAARAQDDAFADWESFHRAFTNWAADSTQVADVRSLLIERDAGTIALEEGRLALAVPFGGRRVAAVFQGRGTISFAPRSEIERQQLRRFYGTTMLRRPFERMTLVFSDSTLRELSAALRFHADTLGQLARAWNATFSYFTVRNLRFARPLPIVQMLLDGDDNGLFWALATDRKNDQPLFFSLVPEFTERVQLARRPEDDRSGLVRHFNAETVCQFFAAGDPDTIHRDVRPAYEATHYAIDATIASDLKLVATADLDIAAHGHPRRWLGLQLPDELRIDEVACGGRPQKFFQEVDNPLVWVRLDEPIPAGGRAVVRVRYHGECFTRDGDTISHRFTTSWYPRPWYGADATWDLTFHYPRELQLLAPGTRVSFDDSGPVQHATWAIRRPLALASFDVGFLRGIRVTGDSLPPLTVWFRHVDGAGRVRDADVATLDRARDYDSRVARDVARCFQFFTQQLGPPLAPSFNAVETPLSVYEGYPGLVHMVMREAKQLPGVQYAPDVVRAHEVSHQWFGLGAAPATYHDVWLSEGFANFCSLWYLQASRHDTRHYLEVLEAWREDLLKYRGFLLGGSQEAGPIWLGQRTKTSATPEDLTLVIYAKGAWVLHMLRNYLLDENDPSESRFRNLMKGYYRQFAGRRAFTEDFRAAVEAAAGEDMGWFFEQWVYGTDVPTYRFSWTATPADGGQWRIRGRVEQSNVPESFRMPVLVRVSFGKNEYSRQRVWVRGPVTDFELPLSPRKPTEVTFNDLQSVLCEIAK